MIQVQNLTFRYPGAPHDAVKDCSFDIAPGQIVGLLGPSGAGKSTIQKIMIKLLPMGQGEITYNGRSIRDLDRAFFNSVGVSFEHPNVFPKLTARENLNYFAGLYDTDPIPPEEILASVGLASDIDKLASDFSKGMKQRLVLARALQHRPNILFLDEPTSGLDPATSRVIMELIGEQRARGAMILLTTHNMLVADTLCDQLAFLHDGAIAAMDTPHQLKLDHGERAVTIEHTSQGTTQQVTLKLDDPDDQAQLATLIQAGHITTIHTREATLDQIFIDLTGQELAS